MAKCMSYEEEVMTAPSRYVKQFILSQKMIKDISTIVHLERMQTSTTQNEVLETRQSRRLRKMLKMGQVSIPFRTSHWVKNEGK